jgi:hypothetical protein
MEIKRADWVTCKGMSTPVGLVKRIASDGTWADVDWHTHTKRMRTRALEVQHTISLGNGVEVTDMTRLSELGTKQARQPAQQPEKVTMAL